MVRFLGGGDRKGRATSDCEGQIRQVGMSTCYAVVFLVTTEFGEGNSRGLRNEKAILFSALCPIGFLGRNGMAGTQWNASLQCLAEVLSFERHSLQDLLHDVIGGDSICLGAESRNDAVPKDGACNCSDVFLGHRVASMEDGASLGRED